MINSSSTSPEKGRGLFLKWVFLSLAVTLIFHGEAFAGAWVQEKGRGLGIVTVRWYESGQRWDSDRNISDSPRYRKLELNPFFEYGFTGRLTAGINPFLLGIDSSGQDTSGLSDVELLGRYLLSKEGFHASSAQLLVKVPGPYTTGLAPGLGEDQYDIEARLLHGHGGTLSTGSWYANIEGGIRKRFGAPSDEIRLDWTVAWKGPDGRWELEAKQENIFSLRNGENPSGEYSLHKLIPSVRYWHSGAIAVQAGFSADLFGRNTGKGAAAIAALWVRF